ncbi:MAG: hypothetical protein LUD72_05380 [Bacteroidales bacterium]|nr:hypothetical protein [Bacteroidales bacterium]
MTDTTADYVLSGTLSSTVTVTGKSITLDDTVVVSNDNRLNLKANGSSVIKIYECENVVIQNLTFDDTYSGYNGVEISLTQGGTTYPKNILVDGCEIGSTFSNNTINVYATADNATVAISNCHFQDKITLNFTDLIHAGEKVCPADPYSVCGVDDGIQVVYTYADKHGKWYAADNKEMYPIVTFA